MNNWLGLNATHWHSKHVLLHNVDTVANMCPCYPLHGPITICPCHTIATWMASTSEGCCSCGPEPSKPTQHDLMQNIDPPLSDSSCQHNKPVWRDISYDIIEKLPATKPTTSLQNQSFGVTRREKPFKSGSAQQEGPTAFEQQWGLKAKQPTHHRSQGAPARPLQRGMRRRPCLDAVDLQSVGKPKHAALRTWTQPLL